MKHRPVGESAYPKASYAMILSEFASWRKASGSRSTVAEDDEKDDSGCGRGCGSTMFKFYHGRTWKSIFGIRDQSRT